MHPRKLFRLFALTLCWLSACTPPPPVDGSREILWKKFAHQSIDTVLLAWGPPAGETRLTDGSRLITYRHATVYDDLSSYARTTGCEVSFLAHAPDYRIDNIAMQGDADECHLLALGKTGIKRDVYEPPPFYPYYYR